MAEPLRIFLGYDSKEPTAFHVAAHSILTRSSGPVSIIPLVQSQLRTQGLYTRERGQTESTEFSLTRFLVPALCDYQGFAVFADSDILCQGDLWQMTAPYRLERWSSTAVWCVQHDYETTQTVKFLGQINVPYPRKNWSSVMFFNTARCKALTPQRVNILSGMELHRFSWLAEERLGKLPQDFNWLVGEYQPNPDAKILHYTLGTPCFPEYAECDHADLWHQERDRMLGLVPV